ncbi:uncharacterized protein LOC116542354 [Sapajus apella]|uniref:Uncharacterized protein LOC116542354 n=1 Tax=Sapajus apella TaxID=9515 RepID=A0A6J3GZE0_SAPAP|nr:uncharacterized protein LOC116542354 [Sapajus apella]
MLFSAWPTPEEGPWVGGGLWGHGRWGGRLKASSPSLLPLGGPSFPFPFFLLRPSALAQRSGCFSLGASNLPPVTPTHSSPPPSSSALPCPLPAGEDECLLSKGVMCGGRGLKWHWWADSRRGGLTCWGCQSSSPMAVSLTCGDSERAHCPLFWAQSLGLWVCESGLWIGPEWRAARSPCRMSLCAGTAGIPQLAAPEKGLGRSAGVAQQWLGGHCVKGSPKAPRGPGLLRVQEGLRPQGLLPGTGWQRLPQALTGAMRGVRLGVGRCKGPSRACAVREGGCDCCCGHLCPVDCGEGSQAGREQSGSPSSAAAPPRKPMGAFGHDSE